MQGKLNRSVTTSRSFIARVNPTMNEVIHPHAGACAITIERSAPVGRA
jgi:hypothetical protein